MFRLKACAWIAFVLVAACDSSGASDAAVDLIRSNRDRWRSMNVSSYEHVFRRTCQCPPADVVVVRVRVVNNNVVQITRVEDDSAVPQSEWGRYLNVEGVFALLEDHIRKDNARLSIQYDSAFNFPQRAVGSFTFQATPAFEVIIEDFQRIQ